MSKYTELITNYHATKPLFFDHIDLSTRPLIDVSSTMSGLVGEFAELLELIQAFGTERGVKWSDEARLALEWKARWGDRAA